LDSSLAATGTTLAGAAGGSGGDGGTGQAGGTGGESGSGGEGGCHPDIDDFCGQDGGGGGPGGDGGAGGASGGGLGGPSAGVYQAGGASGFAGLSGTTLTAGGGGIGGLLPGGARSATGPSAARLRTATAPNTSSADFDADAVGDAADLCPDVPRGTDTDGDGCPDSTRLADADSDAIPDSVDACPAVARGALDVDEDGCPDGGGGDPGGGGPGSPVANPGTPAAGGGTTGPSARVVNPRFVYDADWDRRVTRFVAFVVSDIAAGTTVRLTCRGRGCPKKPYRKTFPRATRRVDLSAHLRRAKLRVGTVLELRSTAPGARGTVQRFVVRRNKRPLVTQLCLPAGATRAARC
jgi:hypothetical protein